MHNNDRETLLDLDKPREKRSEIRYGVSGLVPASMRAKSGRDFELIVIDVSRAGLGILADDCEVKVGDTLDFCLEGQVSIELRVQWMRQPQLVERHGLHGLVRIGLAAVAKDLDLLSCLESFACIDK